LDTKIRVACLAGFPHALASDSVAPAHKIANRLLVTVASAFVWRAGCRVRARVSPRIVVLSVLAIVACQREQRSFDGRAYTESAWSVSEGKQLYDGMNCGGCHARGGGDLGPPLGDNAWRYGSSPQEVLSSILDGRPRGMPAFKTKLTASDAVKLAAYVRSIAGLVRMDSQSPRDDHMGPPSRQR
jgi:mono/diheme cytochrome c family protein